MRIKPNKIKIKCVVEERPGVPQQHVPLDLGASKLQDTREEKSQGKKLRD